MRAVLDLVDDRESSAVPGATTGSHYRHYRRARRHYRGVHYGRAEQILERRAAALREAFEANPARFKGRVPSPGVLPEAVWINPPKVTP